MGMTGLIDCYCTGIIGNGGFFYMTCVSLCKGKCTLSVCEASYSLSVQRQEARGKEFCGRCYDEVTYIMELVEAFNPSHIARLKDYGFVTETTDSLMKFLQRDFRIVVHNGRAALYPLGRIPARRMRENNKADIRRVYGRYVRDCLFKIFLERFLVCNCQCVCPVQGSVKKHAPLIYGGFFQYEKLFASRQ